MISPLFYSKLIYRTRAIISRGLYFFFGQFLLWLRLILQTIYVLNMEILHFLAQNPRLITKSGFKSRAAYDGARTVHILDRNRMTPAFPSNRRFYEIVAAVC